MNGHLTICLHLSRNCLYRQSSLTSAILSHVGLHRFSAGGEYIQFQFHVAAEFGPFVVMPGQDRADQADDGAAAGEDPQGVGKVRADGDLDSSRHADTGR